MIAVILTADSCYGAGIVFCHTAYLTVGSYCHTELYGCALVLLLGGQQCAVLIIDDHTEVLEVSCHSTL